MTTNSEDTNPRRSVNDANEGLRIRLAGRVLPDPGAVAPDLQRLVLQRLDPAFQANEEMTHDG